MTLWNLIRDFFVQFVFGGTTSYGHSFSGCFLGIFSTNDLYYQSINTDTFFVPFNITHLNAEFDTLIDYISFGDWLSTTATIITLIGLFIAITMFIIKLVKWISNTIAMR